MRSCSGEATKDGQRTTDNGNEQGTTGSRQRTTKERSTEQRLCVPVCLFVYTGGREKGQAGWLSGTLAKLPAAQGRTPDDADTHITAIGDEIDVCTREAFETVCVWGARGQQYAAVRVGGGRGRGGRRRHSLPQTDGETDRDRCGGPLQDNPGRRLEGDWPGLRRRRKPAPALLLLLPPLPSRCCRCSGCLLPDRKGGAAAPQNTCTRASPRRFETTALRLGAALCSQPDARRDRRPEDGEGWSETDSVPAGRSSCSAQRSADRRCGASCGSGRGGSGTLVLS